MLKAEQIPPEAVEAARRAFTEAMLSEPQEDPIAAALRAGLAAWPGMAVNDGCPVWHAYPHIILPLPKEPT